MWFVDEPYRRLVAELAVLAGGKLPLTDVTDTYDYDRKEGPTFGFTFRGKRYERELVYMGDYYDYASISLINSAIGEALGRRFYGTDGASILYLTEAQAAALGERFPTLALHSF